MRLKALVLARIRFGYLRLTVLLRREGWAIGKNLVYRLYRKMDHIHEDEEAASIAESQPDSVANRRGA